MKLIFHLHIISQSEGQHYKFISREEEKKEYAYRKSECKNNTLDNGRVLIIFSVLAFLSYSGCINGRKRVAIVVLIFLFVVAFVCPCNCSLICVRVFIAPHVFRACLFEIKMSNEAIK